MKPEALLWLRQMQGELEQGFDYQGSKTLLKEYLHQWLDTSKMALWPKTADGYEMIMHEDINTDPGPDTTELRSSKIHSTTTEPMRLIAPLNEKPADLADFTPIHTGGESINPHI